jgi:phosphodiesterase/alkaline phosphatase D-like protein
MEWRVKMMEQPLVPDSVWQRTFSRKPIAASKLRTITPSQIHLAPMRMRTRQSITSTTRIPGILLLLSLSLLGAGCSRISLPLPLSLPNGVASGDVDQTSAVLWTRSTVTGPLTFTYSLVGGIEGQPIVVPVDDPQRPVTVTIDGLQPATSYRYTAENALGQKASGRFRTAAPPGSFDGLRFAASGDWRGDLAPFPAMSNIPGRELNFFLLLGDAIYADIGSPAVLHKAESLADFRRKYAEVLRSAGGNNEWARLRAATSLFAIFDDHEVTNDFAGGAQAAADRRFAESSGFINDTTLYESAIQAFQEYHPLRAEFYAKTGVDARVDGERRFYRYRTYGNDAALFLVDSRSFRDLPLAPARMGNPTDEERFLVQSYRPGRTLLGTPQLTVLRRDLLHAQNAGVTWKFVTLSVPIQYRGLLSAQDRYEGYAAERADLLAYIDQTPICNVVFVSADIHGTLVNDISYALAPHGQQIPTSAFEVTVGPVAFDPPQGPVLVRHGVDASLISLAEEAIYASLPVANDPDSQTDDKDDWVKAYIDRQLSALGYGAVGLAGSPVKADLLQGDYAALHTYGWTEFAVDAQTQLLTVTTYGIPPYGLGDLQKNLSGVLARQPTVVSQFQVWPDQRAQCRSDR